MNQHHPLIEDARPFRALVVSEQSDGRFARQVVTRQVADLPPTTR
jgi:hypothetical protein